MVNLLASTNLPLEEQKYNWSIKIYRPLSNQDTNREKIAPAKD